MEQMHLRAVWNPSANGFDVRFTAKGHTHIEFMTESRYVEFCRDLDSEIKIAGWRLRLDGQGSKETAQGLRNYFRAVLESYEQSK